MSFVNESTVSILIENLNVSAKLNGSVKAAFFKGDLDYMTLHNLTIQIDLGFTDLGKGIWKVTDSSMINIGGIFLNTTNKNINSLLVDSEAIIVDLLNTQLASLEESLSDLINKLNDLIATHTDTTFLLDLFKSQSLYLNYTTPIAPH
jgi:hypothetical protein